MNNDNKKRYSTGKMGLAHFSSTVWGFSFSGHNSRAPFHRLIFWLKNHFRMSVNVTKSSKKMNRTCGSDEGCDQRETYLVFGSRNLEATMRVTHERNDHQGWWYLASTAEKNGTFESRYRYTKCVYAAEVSSQSFCLASSARTTKLVASSLFGRNQTFF